MARRSALLIAAVGIAALGTIMIILYVRGIDARAKEDQELVEVLHATAVIQPGESIEDAQASGKIDTIEINRIALVDGALSKTDTLEGKVAIETIYPDEQIIAQKWGSPGAEAALNIPDDKLAISVNLTDPARVAGFVNPGSNVAIFYSADPELLKPDGSTQKLPTYTRVLLTKVQVIGVGATSMSSRTTTNEEGESTTEELPRTLLTLAVDQKQAEEVIYAARNGDLSFALLSDKSVVRDGPGVTLNDLMPELIRLAR